MARFVDQIASFGLVIFFACLVMPCDGIVFIVFCLMVLIASFPHRYHCLSRMSNNRSLFVPWGSTTSRGIRPIVQFGSISVGTLRSLMVIPVWGHARVGHSV